MVISQLLVNKIEWNKFHFVQTWPRFILQFFPGDENPIVQFFSDTVCICSKFKYHEDANKGCKFG